MHINKCLDHFDIPLGYPNSYIGGGHTMALSANIFSNPINELWTFIFDMYDNTRVYDISYRQYTTGVVDLSSQPFCLENTKCPLHILVRRLLSLCKANFIWICWVSNRLHKDGPPRVYPISQM